MESLRSRICTSDNLIDARDRFQNRASPMAAFDGRTAEILLQSSGSRLPFVDIAPRFRAAAVEEVRSLPPALSPQNTENAPLRDASGAFFVGRLLAELNVRPAELAKGLGLKAGQVYAWDKPEAVEPRDESVRDALGRMVKVVEVLRHLMPSRAQDGGPTPLERRQLWLHNPQPAFRFERPIDLLLNGRGEEVFEALWGLYIGQSSL